MERMKEIEEYLSNAEISHEIRKYSDGKTSSEGEYYGIIEFWTDTSGQDIPTEFDFDGTAEDFVKKFSEAAENYDVDEEVELYSQMRGQRGVPNTIKELLDDCTEAKNTLLKIARDLNGIINGKGISEEADTKFDVCVYGYIFPALEAENENEAKMMACDEYYSITGIKAYTDDDAVVWKESFVYPYEWK